jgi:NTE family protein
VTGDGNHSFFRGVPESELADVLSRLERRSYKSGAVLVAEGDRTGEVYIAQSGRAEVVVSDAKGVEHRVGGIGPGGTVGEMSILTSQPAAATVRAATDLDVLVLPEREFGDLADRFPEISRNLGAILSERLARTNRLVGGGEQGTLTILEDTGAPALLGYALACSLTWHTRLRTLLLVLDEAAAPELHALAARQNRLGAEVRVAAPTGDNAPDRLAGTVSRLFKTFDHVLVQTHGSSSVPLATGRIVRLTGRDGPPAVDGLTLRGWAAPTPLFRPDLDGIVRVPPLSAEDERSLANGVLANSSAAGHALGWAARDIAGLKVGLALGAGSIRGYAHIGVLQVLQRAGIRFDYVTGTSIGAAVAGMVSIEATPEEIGEFMDDCGRRLFRPTLPVRSLLSSRGLGKIIQRVRGDIRFEELSLPLAVVCADVLTGRELVFRRGVAWPAVLAAVSIPGIYPAQRIGPYVVIDGGVANPVPTDVAADMGAGFVIGVKLGARRSEPDNDAEGVLPSGSGPSAVAVLLRAIELMQSRIEGRTADATTITIAPEVDAKGMQLRRFSEGRRYIQDGIDAAEAALPRIEAALPWLRKR